MNQPISGPPSANPTIPEMLDGQTLLRFKCYPGISCFNACCKKSDITLTPYDVVRLKQHFNLTSDAFLKQYTVPFQMDGDGMPGIKMRTTEEGACVLLSEQGCSVYADRPIVCRYYPVALLNFREQNTSEAKEFYSLVKEEHCKGHMESRELSIDEYRTEQGCTEYDTRNREWYRLILKKRSAGPGVGRPSEMSLQMFFMASYNIDLFRRFVLSDNFRGNYKLEENFYDIIAKDDLVLLDFSFRFLRQVLFGERSVEEVDNAWERRLGERNDVWELRVKAMQAAREAQQLEDDVPLD